MPDAGPLAGTVARVGAVYGEDARLCLGIDGGSRWLRLDAVLAGGLDTLFADVEADAGGRRDYAGAAVAAGLADALVTAGWPALLLDRRLPDVRPVNVAVRRHEDEAWFDRVALLTPGCFALPGDPEAGYSDVAVVGTVADLHERFAAQLVDAVGPWFAAVRARAPFGRRGMWGQLADAVCATALGTARHAGTDQRAAWDEAQDVLDHVAARVPELRVRPQPFPVRWSGGEALFQVKGTCCLWYVCEKAAEYGDDAYCSSCPLRDDGSRRSRLTAWLEEEAAAG
ncbi:MAG: hypothetical protein ACT4PW_03075 [Acidimicrobiia bacterium]